VKERGRERRDGERANAETERDERETEI